MLIPRSRPGLVTLPLEIAHLCENVGALIANVLPEEADVLPGAFDLEHRPLDRLPFHDLLPGTDSLL